MNMREPVIPMRNAGQLIYAGMLRLFAYFFFTSIMPIYSLEVMPSRRVA